MTQENSYVVSPRPPARIYLPMVALASSILLCLGCSGTQLGGTSSTPTPVGGLSLSASNLSFGNVQVGGKKSMSLSITSTGGQGSSVEISHVTISGNGFAGSSVALPATLASGQSLTLSVEFTPKSAGSASGTLSIESNANNATLSVPLSGSGLAPAQLAINPASMTFSNVAVGSQQNQTGTLTSGSSSITVSSASWNGSGFALSGITFPVTIPSGQSVSFTVTFSPQVAGTVTGNISFLSDADNSPVVESLNGTGLQSTQHHVDLNWSPDPSTVQGYYVYRGTQTGGPYAKISSLQNGNSYVDGNVLSGQTYYYVVTALAANSAESSYSNEAVAAIP